MCLLSVYTLPVLYPPVLSVTRYRDAAEGTDRPPGRGPLGVGAPGKRPRPHATTGVANTGRGREEKVVSSLAHTSPGRR